MRNTLDRINDKLNIIEGNTVNLNIIETIQNEMEKNIILNEKSITESWDNFKPNVWVIRILGGELR